ncbi:MAG: YggT family protein [Verrucomicrobia bacterium]|nr:YggT family protein [Verrucomicrobiota bacterium]
MGLINSILNLAGLLLWLGWRDVTSGSLLQNSTTPLVRTLRQAGTSVVVRRKYLGGLAGLLVLRAVIYWWIGPAVNWTPKLDLVAIVIPFRSEFFGRTLLFSLCSFGVTLAGFYLSLLLLSLVNRSVPDTEPLQKFVRSHLGPIERLPWLVKLLLPFAAAILLRLGLSPLLGWWEIIPAATTVGATVRQGLFIGLGACLVWKYVIAGLLLLHFLNSYVYFGSHPLWNFVNLTSRRLLAPLRWVPLRFGRMDFAPVVGIVGIFLLAELLEHWLPKIYPA